MIVILKHGSSNILWLASTVIVPLSNVAFSLDIMPGHKPMKPIDVVSLCVIMAGLVVYRFTPTIIMVCFVHVLILIGIFTTNLNLTLIL